MSKLSVSAWLLIPSILILAFWIRVQGTEGLSDKQFTETDAYFYYWQAHLISEHSRLPTRDMHRWLPLGRDLGQTLNLYGYVLAYTHRAIAVVFPKISLYDVTLYMPPICFCIGLSAFCLFLYHTNGIFCSVTVGLLLATLPGSIERATAGFGDRDAFCLMLGILAVITYLASLQAQKSCLRLLWTLLSGVIVFLGGISWEGFGVFLSVIIVVELWRFLASETQEGFHFYFLWMLCFVPTLYLASPAYRNGYGFAEHLTAFVLVPPVVLLWIRAIRFLLMEKVSVLRQHTRSLSLGLTIASLALASTFVLVQYSTFDNTTVPLSQNAVMQTMTELKAPHFWYWIARYGSIFVLGSLGFVLMPFILWKKQGSFLSILIALFAVFSFFREPLDKVWGEPFGNALFGVVIMMCLLTLIFLAWKRKNTDGTSEFIPIAFTVWFIVWVALSRDAKRYDFFIGIALAFGTATVIQSLLRIVVKKITVNTKSLLSPTILKSGVTALLLILVMFFPPYFAHTYRSVYAATGMRKSTPGRTPVAETFCWMNSNLPRDAIVAAHWRYGSQLNVIAGVKTITDQDTYLQHWIHLYYRHVIYAETEREALEFLKTHGATHLMLVGQSPAKYFLSGQISDAFVPVYPIENFADTTVNVWEIHYPPDIQTHPKYLKTDIDEIDRHLEWKIK